MDIWEGLNKISIILTIIGFVLGNVSGMIIHKKIIKKNSNNKNIIKNRGNNTGVQIANNNGDINVRQ